MTRHRIEIEVALLHILAVIRFGWNESEVAFFQNRIALIPERHREAEDLIAIAKSADAVFAPAIRLRSREIMRQVIPRVALRAVVLAHRSPRAVRQIRTPLAPLRDRMRITRQALLLGGHGPPKS